MFKIEFLFVVVEKDLMSEFENIILILPATFLPSCSFIRPAKLVDKVIYLLPALLTVLASLRSQPATLGPAAKYAAILFHKVPNCCSFPTSGSLLVFNHYLMSTTSSTGVYFLLSLCSAGVSLTKFEPSVP